MKKVKRLCTWCKRNRDFSIGIAFGVSSISFSVYALISGNYTVVYGALLQGVAGVLLVVNNLPWGR